MPWGDTNNRAKSLESFMLCMTCASKFFEASLSLVLITVAWTMTYLFLKIN